MISLSKAGSTILTCRFLQAPLSGRLKGNARQIPSLCSGFPKLKTLSNSALPVMDLENMQGHGFVVQIVLLVLRECENRNLEIPEKRTPPGRAPGHRLPCLSHQVEPRPPAALMAFSSPDRSFSSSSGCPTTPAVWRWSHLSWKRQPWISLPCYGFQVDLS